MTKQLDQQQLMDIAKEIVSKPAEKMPDYLTKQEEETVKELVKTIRASNLAMKTYVQQMNYNDALRKQIQIESSVKRSLERTIRAEADYSSQWNLLMQVSKRIKATQATLSASDQAAVKDLNRFIAKQQKKLAKLFAKNGIYPSSDLIKRGKEARMAGQIHSFLARSFSTSVEAAICGDALAGAAKTLKELEAKLWSTNPSLAQTASWLATKMGDAEDELIWIYSLPSDDARESLNAKASAANRDLRHSQKELRHFERILPKQQALTEQQQQLTLSMGRWYIVAALAETFIELGQSLAY